ncbi:ribulose-phosphate 3-epimerase [Candidatus Woesearchaeota archaeon]|nr:MAG: ribulose-phosphate 3-epimerase [Candidatus Woesearchaeota archaeon]
MGKLKVSVSILSADFSKLQSEIDRVSNADMLHIDVMDSHFVPELTFGPVVIKNLATKLPFDVHLMVTNPEKHIEPFAQAGADAITFHAEAVADIKKVIDKIHAAGLKAGVALNPDTPLDPIEEHLESIDRVLIMSVFPGYAGQKFIPDVVPKIKALRARYNGEIAVDGGINSETGKIVAEAGADILVAASFVYKNPEPAKAVEELRNCLNN